MKLDRHSLLANLWILTILLYLFRSTADPLKYPFILSFGILLLSFTILFILNFRKEVLLKFSLATKEYLILGVFLALGIGLSSKIEPLSIKGLINFLGIIVFYFIYIEYRRHIKLNRLYLGWIFMAIFIGIVGLLKWLNYLIEFDLNWFSIFYKRGTSLVSDYNIYSFYFILSLVIFFHAISREVIRTKPIVNIPILIVYILNAALTGSRRGIILLVFFFLIGIIFLIRRKKGKNRILVRNLIILNLIILAVVSVITALIPFRSRIIQNPSTKSKITKTIYRYSTIISPGITYNILYDKVWPKVEEYEHDRTDWDIYSTYNNTINGEINNRYIDQKGNYWASFEGNRDSKNLLYNGDFIFGQEFWKIGAPDSITHEIIDTEYGKAIRVNRYNGKGFWPLKYDGRSILYYKGVSYTFRFKFRVIKGSGVPFRIGWWVNEGDGFRNNLSFNIRALENDWFEYTASYRFKDDQRNLQTFMNSQKANTIIDFADIELTCDDATSRPCYLDQVIGIKGPNLFYNSNFENGLKFWGSDTPDSIKHEQINTQFGNAIRVSRGVGKGYWPLIYQGRELFYHENLTYYFRFKFRVVKGNEVPFQIGWWANKEETNPFNLYKDIFPLTKGWFECIASYQFKNNYYGNVKAFMNSQQANTIVDFTDIELICSDTHNHPMYADEMTYYIDSLELLRLDIELADTRELLLSTRISRWKYSFEIWMNEYKWKDRLIGGGFDYLKKFGEKFYPDEERIDYPHNTIISSFLFSGIIGGAFYIYFLILSFVYYWKQREKLSLLFILYTITFIFIFISSDSHFNVPIFALLSLTPFITRYILKENNKV